MFGLALPDARPVNKHGTLGTMKYKYLNVGRQLCFQNRIASVIIKVRQDGGIGFRGSLS